MFLLVDPEEAKQTDPVESDGKPNQTLTKNQRKYQKKKLKKKKRAMKEQQASGEKQASADEISGSSQVVTIPQLMAKYDACVEMICERAEKLNNLEGLSRHLFFTAIIEMHYALSQNIARSLAQCDDDELELEQKGKGQEPGLVS